MRKGFLALMMFAVLAPANARVFYASDYGCVAGGQDNSSQFRRIAADINKEKGGTLVFEKGKQYYVEIKPDFSSGHTAEPSADATAFFFQHCGNLKIDLNGSTIIVKANNSTKYAIFRLQDCASFSIRDGTLQGDADGHDYSAVTYGGKRENSTHEWGHGIIVNGSKGMIENLHIFNMTGDGIKTGSFRSKNGVYHAKVTIRDVEIYNCRRNGIACLSSCGTKIQRTTIHEIGSFGKVKGTSPEAGIDLEYEDGVGDAGDVTIRNCRISDCTQKVISASNSTPPTPRKLLIEKCYLEGSNFQIANTKPVKCMTVSNCTVVHCPINLGKAKVTNTTFDLRQSVNYVSGGDYCNCSFKGVLDGLESVHGCTITGTNLDEAKFTDCTFADIRAANNNSPAYQGFSAYNFPLCASFYRCNFTNCSFVRGNPKYASSFSFYSSELSDGCMIYNENDDIPVTFSKCTLTDVSAYQTQKGRFQFTKSTIIQCDTSVSQPLLLFGTNTLVRCNVIDNVGFPESAKRHGIKAYKLDASRSNIEMTSGHVVTAGMALTKGSVKGVDKESFKGNDTSVKFK